MKKILLFVSSFLIVNNSFSQLDLIQNPEFEDWTTGEPTNWGTSNSTYGNLLLNGSAIQATGGDLLGSNTLVLTTRDSAGTSFPGIAVSNGNVTLSGTTPVVNGALPYRIRPQSLTYVSKYTSGGGSDAPEIKVVLTKWNTTLERRDTLGVSHSTANSSTYTRQTLTMSYSATPPGGNPTTINNYAAGATSPDSIQIIIASSGATGAFANSTLMIDSLEFIYDCTLDPAITTTGNLAVLIPGDGNVLTATAGQAFSQTVTNYIPASVSMPVTLGTTGTFNLTTDIDSVESSQRVLSGSAANFLSISSNATNGRAGGNSISCFTITGTIPSTPANATYNLIVSPIMWGSSFVGDLTEFPSPITSTYTIKVGSGSSPMTSTDNIKWRNMNYIGENRVYNIYVPSSYDGSTAVPLLFNIHGWTGSSTKQMDFGDFRAIADTANFIIVHPQALGDIPSWDGTGTSDSEFLMTLLDSLEAEYNIDTDRIYSTGFSQGAGMSYKFACEHSDRIAAVAPVAGNLSAEGLSACEPTHLMPVMQIHGTEDPLASYTGSPSIISIVEYWAKLNGCDTVPVITQLNDLTTVDNSTVEHYVYSGGNEGIEVEHYKVIAGGHQWPTLTPTKNNYGLAERNLDFDASSEIWRFLSKYKLSELSSLTSIDNNISTHSVVTISPNPSTDKFTVDVSNYKNAKLIVMDLLGNIILENLLQSRTTNFDLNGYSRGVYIYKVQNQSENIATGKIVLQ